MRRITTLLLVAVAGLVLASCGEATERLTEEAIEQSAGGGEVDIEEDGSVSIENDDGSFSADADGNVNIESEDGSFNIDGQSGELPDDFPDVPLPDDFEVRTSSSQSDGEGTIFSVHGTVDGADGEELLEEMTERYEAEGYEVTSEYGNTAGDTFSGGVILTDGDRNVTVSLNDGGSDDPATVSINVAPASE